MEKEYKYKKIKNFKMENNIDIKEIVKRSLHLM